MDTKSIFVAEEKPYPMDINSEDFTTMLGPFRYDALKYHQPPKDVKEALSYFEYGSDPTTLPMRLPTEEEFATWQRKSSTIFHPDKIGSMGNQMFSTFRECCNKILSFLKDADEDCENVSIDQLKLHNEKVWNELKVQRNHRYQFLMDTIGIMTDDECDKRIKDYKNQISCISKERHLFSDKQSEEAIASLVTLDEIEDSLELLEEWKPTLKILNSGVKLYAIKRTACNAVNCNPKGRILFPIDGCVKKIKPYQRGLISTLLDTCNNRIRSIDPEVKRQLAICAVGEKFCEARQDRIDDLKATLKSSIAIKRYCENLLKPSRGNDESIVLVPDQNKILCKQEFTDVVNLSCNNLTKRYTSRKLVNTKRARDARLETTKIAQDILINHGTPGQILWAVRVIDYFEHPEDFVPSNESYPPMSEDKRYDYRGDIRGRERPRCDYVTVPSSKIKSSNENVVWWCHTVMHPRRNKNKMVTVYHQQGTAKVQRLFPTPLQREGFLKEAHELRPKVKVNRAKRVVKFWNDMAEIKRQKRLMTPDDVPVIVPVKPGENVPIALGPGTDSEDESINIICDHPKPFDMYSWEYVDLFERPRLDAATFVDMYGRRIIDDINKLNAESSQ